MTGERSGLNTMRRRTSARKAFEIRRRYIWKVMTLDRWRRAPYRRPPLPTDLGPVRYTTVTSPTKVKTPEADRTRWWMNKRAVSGHTPGETESEFSWGCHEANNLYLPLGSSYLVPSSRVFDLWYSGSRLLPNRQLRRKSPIKK